MTKICEYCKKEFERTWQDSVGAWNRQRFCSVECRNKSRDKGGCYWKDKDGYIIKDWVEDGKKVRGRLNRLVMERGIGRKLRRDEIVHHKDGNKENNAIENLQIIDGHYLHKVLYHKIPWNKDKITITEHKCKNCGLLFTTKSNRTLRKFCSRKCSNLFRSKKEHYNER